MVLFGIFRLRPKIINVPEIPQLDKRLKNTAVAECCYYLTICQFIYCGNKLPDVTEDEKPNDGD